MAKLETRNIFRSEELDIAEVQQRITSELKKNPKELFMMIDEESNNKLIMITGEYYDELFAFKQEMMKMVGDLEAKVKQLEG
ncbi:MAG: hypothetical protein ACK411_10870 [Exiguobacterium mexicanum]